MQALRVLLKAKAIVGQDHLLVNGVNEFSEIEQFSVDWRKKFYGKPLLFYFQGRQRGFCLITLVNAHEAYQLFHRGKYRFSRWSNA